VWKWDEIVVRPDERVVVYAGRDPASKSRSRFGGCGRASVERERGRHDALIRSDDDLVAIFHDTARPAMWPRIAGVGEFGVYGATLAPLPYEGGVLRVLEACAPSTAGCRLFEKAGGPLIALKKNDARSPWSPAASSN